MPSGGQGVRDWNVVAWKPCFSRQNHHLSLVEDVGAEEPESGTFQIYCQDQLFRWGGAPPSGGMGPRALPRTLRDVPKTSRRQRGHSHALHCSSGENLHPETPRCSIFGSGSVILMDNGEYRRNYVQTPCYFQVQHKFGVARPPKVTKQCAWRCAGLGKLLQVAKCRFLVQDHFFQTWPTKSSWQIRQMCMVHAFDGLRLK